MIKYPVSKPWFTAHERELLTNVFDTGFITQGPTVSLFERELASYLKVPHVVACSSGTTALHLALAAFLEPGAEVLVPNVTFVATANAAVYAGCQPVLCDVDPIDWSLCLKDAARKVSGRTMAMVVVHLYGQPANMRAYREFADEHGLVLIEDAAEGFGGFDHGRAMGTLGAVGTFSFYGNKVLTTGEGGAVVAHDAFTADKLRLLRGQGQDPRTRYYHSVVGFNYRMTEMQAAIGLGQLQRLPVLLANRQRVMDLYRAWAKTEGLTGVNDQAAPWLYTFLVPPNIDRKMVMDLLFDAGIDTRPAFVPLNKLPMYDRPDAQFPVSIDLGARGLSLPTYPELTDDAVRFITSTVSTSMQKLRSGVLV